MNEHDPENVSSVSNPIPSKPTKSPQPPSMRSIVGPDVIPFEQVRIDPVALKPWVTGPKETLEYGLALLEEDTGASRRLAMILIDNAVELMMKIFLELPEETTGLKLGSEAERRTRGAKFPELVRTLKKYAVDKKTGVDFDVVGWYHDIRNELYHHGYGQTVERNKVEAYAEQAKLLFQAFFDAQVEISERSERLESLMADWAKLEKLYFEIAVWWLEDARPAWGNEAITTYWNARSVTGELEFLSVPFPKDRFNAWMLAALGFIDTMDALCLDDLQYIRDEINYGRIDHEKALRPPMIGFLEDVVRKLEGQMEAFWEHVEQVGKDLERWEFEDQD